MKKQAEIISIKNTFPYYKLWLVAIVSCAAILRCYKAVEKGLIYWDEGIFILGARFVRWRSWFLLENLFRDLDPVSDEALVNLYSGLPVFLQKPFHVLSLAVWSIPEWDETVAAISLSIFCSLITVFITAKICCHWFDKPTALVAAIWLALNPYHIHYSRLALHEMTSMALFLLSLELWESNKYRQNICKVFTSGFLAIAAIGASYRYLPFVGLYFLWEFADSFFFHRTSLKSAIKQLCAFLIGAVIVFLGMNLAYRIAFYPEFTWSQPASYIAVLKMKFLGGESSFDFDAPYFYLTMIKEFDGVLTLVILGMGVVTCFLSRKFNHLKLFSFVFVIFVLFSLTTTRVPRSITGLLPFLAIIAALGIMTSYRLLTKTINTKFAAVILAILFIVQVGTLSAKWSNLWSLHAGYADIIQWMNENQITHIYATMQPVLSVELGNKAVRTIPSNIEQLHAGVEKSKTRYMVVDWQKFLRYPDAIKRIEESALPIFVVEHNPGVFFATLHENHLPQDVFKLRQDPSLEYLKVYDLYQVLPEMGYPLSFTGGR